MLTLEWGPCSLIISEKSLCIFDIKLNIPYINFRVIEMNISIAFFYISALKTVVAMGVTKVDKTTGATGGYDHSCHLWLWPQLSLMVMTTAATGGLTMVFSSYFLTSLPLFLRQCPWTSWKHEGCDNKSLSRIF